MLGDGDQKITNAESIGEHRARNQATAANRKNGIGALICGEGLNLQCERLDMFVELLPREDERLGAYLSGRGRVPG